LGRNQGLERRPTIEWEKAEGGVLAKLRQHDQVERFAREVVPALGD
jgi:hypothetical protein